MLRITTKIRLQTAALLSRVDNNHRLSDVQALQLTQEENVRLLADSAAALRDRGHRNIINYSKKVFLPLTQLCRDVCHYCTFAQTPKNLKTPYLTPEAALAIAHLGAKQGCKEALFTLGENRNCATAPLVRRCKH